MAADPRRRIPSVDRLLASPPFAALLATTSRDRLRALLQEVQERLRREIAGGASAPAHLQDVGWYAAAVRRRLDEQERPSLRRVVNATGVVLHTNLGRAPLAAVARDAILAIAHGYSNLEYDLATGARGSRYDHCVALLRELTGAEAALVVNNNAAAIVLAVNTLASGREAVISRGELIEIGGSFRIPDILARSGARMVEVGTTNRTHLQDFASAIGDATGVVLRVHRSNFAVTGFTADVAATDLAALARQRGVPLLHDLGSGLLLEAERLGLPPEPTAAAALGAGADVVTMSGDKLLGGPQAGIVVGRESIVARMRRNPLCRAFRVGKVTLAALEATLALYREPERALREIPTLRMITEAEADVRARAERIAAALLARGVDTRCAPGRAAVGGGAYPDLDLPTWLVVLHADRAPDALLARLRAGETPVVARIVADAAVLDARTVEDADIPLLADAVERALA